MTLETLAACPVCGSNQFDHLLNAIDHTATGESFQVERCRSCNLALTNPRPSASDIGKYYHSKKYISHTGGSSSLLDQVYRRVRAYSIQKKLDLISHYQKAGNLLDFGCGTGEFLLAANLRGWTTVGVEPSPEARQKTDRSLNIHNSLAQVNGAFDVITLWHVLEHVHDLNGTLNKLRSLLNPAGTIFIAVPNHESPDAQHYQEHWAGYDVPRHLWHFAKPSMLKLLAQHNLKTLTAVPMKFDAYYVSLLSESNRRPGKDITNIFLGLVNGLKSNLAAGPDNYSSLIYIASA
jgi:SAM-dependent methyltransferase